MRLAILAALVLLVAVVHARRSASANPAAGRVGMQGKLLLTSIARAEACALAATGRYTSNLEDLNTLARDSLRIDESRAHLSMEVSVGSSGRHFYARATGPGFDDYVQETATLGDAPSMRCQRHERRTGQPRD